MFIVIPAYEPDEKLVKIVHDIKERIKGAIIIIVNDGSDSHYQSLFTIIKNKGTVLLEHSHNQGKGRALKTAFQYIQSVTTNHETVIVTVDSDGQHVIQDIIKVANRTKAEQTKIVLGVRDFIGKVPLRSKFGNQLTASLFNLVTGQKIKDTQTGLRGFPIQLLTFLLQIEGERFEYEFNILLSATQSHVEIAEEAIETVYIEDNKSSHFNPIKDSIKIYLPLLKFVSVSCLVSIVDLLLFIMLVFITNHLLFAILIARIMSALVQFILNKKAVFQSQEQSIRSFLKYGVLVFGMLLLNYLILNSLLTIGMTLIVAKLITEVMLFLMSYKMQQQYVFSYRKV